MPFAAFNPSFSHVAGTKAEWTEYEARYGEGFTARHAEVYAAALRSAEVNDAVRKGNAHAAELLRAAGGNKQAALAAAFAEIDAALAPKLASAAQARAA
jgi:hypothetical protein